MVGEISSLNHEPWNDPMERRINVSEPSVSIAKSLKISGRFGDDVSAKFNRDRSERLVVNRDRHRAFATVRAWKDAVKGFLCGKALGAEAVFRVIREFLIEDISLKF